MGNYKFERVSGGDMLGEVRQLFIEYAQSLDIDLAFQDFETELKTLPGKYAPPRGFLLLASVEGKSAGCIALRKLSDDICEMKRLYVRDAYRRSGIGRRLIDMLIDEAKKLNYKYMRLDTLATMKDALNLYSSFGFYDIEPYVYNPIENARFLELDLGGHCMMKQVYAPGCAFMIYKPELAGKVLDFLNKDLGNIPEHLICCRHEPELERGTRIINTCAGCDRRYRELYEGISTISLWEILAESKTFPFPDYNGMEMSIHDACPTRTEERVHLAIRKLIARMNIKIVEPKNTRTKSICCGDSFYGVLPVDQVKEQMKKRSNEMPCDNVVVYCVSCIKAMYIGGKKPRYIIDLLFNEDTGIGTFEPGAWHDELRKFIDEH